MLEVLLVLGLCFLYLFGVLLLVCHCDPFLEQGDYNAVVYNDDDWQVREHCLRGYEPWFTLHKRRRFLSFSWWSRLQMWSDRTDPLLNFIERWKDFPMPRKIDQPETSQC